MAGDPLAASAPAPGSRHDARAWHESEFPDLFAERDTPGDLGTGILTGRRKPPGQDRPAGDKILNQSISTLPPWNGRSRT